ncbi:MAG: sigma-70 family RNA polymerase sigma factor [Actinobacteria bacterium]|nr:MAG: sigma-70 family RNA polymerase sigma factor [Actinomycetota bacterium]
MTPILARQRPDRSLERLYKKHAGDVYRYALVVLRNEADAEDVTQTTFMNAYRALERGEKPRTPQNWLIAIAHNVCRQRFRQSQRRPNEVELNEELAEAYVEEDAVSAEDIRRALGHLAFNQRAALVMRELEGRSYQEIAEILGLSVSAIETLIFRARRALREQLEEGITCHDAELAISRQLDGRLPRNERGALRAHLRECEECAHFARSQRAHRGAIKSLALIPLPHSLASLFGGSGGAGGGAAALGGGVGIKAAAVGAGALLATGVGYEGARHTFLRPATPHASATARLHAAPVSAVQTAFKPGAPQTDDKPFRGASIKIRRGHHGRPDVKKVHPQNRTNGGEVSQLPPSRARGQGVQHAKKANPGYHTGQTRHQAKTHKPHKPPPPKKKPTPPPPPPNGKGKGPSGESGVQGNGRDKTR